MNNIDVNCGPPSKHKRFGITVQHKDCLRAVTSCSVVVPWSIESMAGQSV